MTKLSANQYELCNSLELNGLLFQARAKIDDQMRILIALRSEALRSCSPATLGELTEFHGSVLERLEQQYALMLDALSLGGCR
jgi:hypothetical protein